MKNNIKEVFVDLRDWGRQYPTGAIAYDADRNCVDSEYCDTVEEFKEFFERNRSRIRDAELTFSVNAEELENCLPVAFRIRSAFDACIRKSRLITGNGFCISEFNG